MILYVLKVIACSALLLGAYHLLFESEKNHRLKRWYLLVCLVLPFLIPLLSFESDTSATEIGTITQFQLAQPIQVHHLSVETVSRFNLLYLIYVAYGVVSIILMVKFMKSLRNIIQKVTRNEQRKFEHYVLVLLPNHTPPHSFLNYLFLGKAAYLANQVAPEILVHEQTHIRQKHSLDILMIEILRAIFWINPFLILYRKAIQINHEFLADDDVLSKGNDLIAYQYLLLQKANPYNQLNLTSPFNYLTTKKRLIMMTSKPSKKMAVLKQTALVAVVALATFLFSERTIGQTPPAVTPPPVPTQPAGQGITKAEMDTYKALENKYTKLSANGKYKTIVGKVSEEDEKTLQQLFKRMSSAQQTKTTIAFIKSPKPLPRVTPTAQQFAQFKIPTTYGIWIDGKHVENKVLDQYEASDFKQVFVSKLYGKAKEGRIYTHQVDLMTIKYYDDYFNKSIANKDQLMMITWKVDQKTSLLKF